MNAKVIFILMTLLVGSYAQSATEENIKNFLKDLRHFVQSKIDEHKGEDDIEIIKHVVIAIDEQVDEFLNKKALSLIEECEIKEHMKEHQEEIARFIKNLVSHVRKFVENVADLHEKLAQDGSQDLLDKREEMEQQLCEFFHGLEKLVHFTIKENVGKGQNEYEIVKKVLCAVHERFVEFIENVTSYFEEKENAEIKEKFGGELGQIKASVEQVLEDVANFVERVDETINEIN